MVFPHGLFCERYQTYVQPPWHTTKSRSTLETQSKFDWYRPWKRHGFPGLIFGGLYFSALSSFKNIFLVLHHQDCKVDSCTRLNLASHLILDFSLWACTAHLPARGLSGRRDRTRGWRIAAGVLFPHTASKNISHMSEWADCGGRRRGRTLIVWTSQHLNIALSRNPNIC